MGTGRERAKEPQPLVSCTRRLPLRAAGRRAHATVIDRVLGFAALWVFSPRRQALTLLECRTVSPALPNVRAKGAPAAGRQARTGENVPRTARLGLVACRWRSL